MIVGIDFDNTLVCYDTIFWKIAREQGVIPPLLPKLKDEVRGHLRFSGAEDLWTELQGIVYGKRIIEADPFPGAIDFITNAKKRGHKIAIISHRTKHPVIGEKTDLHAAARLWLASKGLEQVPAFFETTRALKISRINALSCAVFLDDLIEVFEEPDFPASTRKILFDPYSRYSGALSRVGSWTEFGSSAGL